MRYHDYSEPADCHIDAEPSYGINAEEQAMRESYNYHAARVRSMSVADCKAELSDLLFIVSADPGRVQALRHRIEFAAER